VTADIALPLRRWPRRVGYGLAFGAAGLAVLLPSSTACAGYFFAQQVLTPARWYPLTVRSVHGSRIVVTRSEDTERPIPLGLAWRGGHAILGDIVSVDRNTIVRELSTVVRGALKPRLRAYTTGAVFDGDPRTAHGLEFTSAFVPGPLGHYPAWVVPGAPSGLGSDTWLIAVHGRGASRTEALRILPALASSGASGTFRSYRNDLGAPAARDGSYHLGATEWQDLAAAASYARAAGAPDLILYGWSMGGAAAMNIHGKNNFAVGTIGDAIRAFDLVTPRGDVLTCDRERNAELFHGAIGGYGGLGVIVEAELELVPNERIERVVETMDVRDYREWFVREMRANHSR